MAWYSHTLAFVISCDQAADESEPRKLLDRHKGDFENFVYAPSRNGCLLWRLGSICKLSSHGANLYLLEDACLLKNGTLTSATLQLASLIDEIESHPALVVEATKEPYQPNITLHTAGFAPQPAELVYASDAVIKDGWVYNHSEDEVRQLLAEAGPSQTPCPDGDDDGESLLYVFTFLKSHLSLLRLAAESGSAVVYGETNQ